jgi:hypothetical protein
VKKGVQAAQGEEEGSEDEEAEEEENQLSSIASGQWYV